MCAPTGIVDQSHYVEVMPGEFSEKIVPVFIVVPKYDG